MRKHLLSIVMVVCFLLIAGSVLADILTNTEFQGTITYVKDANGKVTRETRTGQWINDDGGVFNGVANIQYANDSSTYLYKNGKLDTTTFQGTVYLTETKRPMYYNSTNSTGGTYIYRYQTQSGKWYMGPGIRSQGSITLMNNNGNVSITDNRKSF